MKGMNIQKVLSASVLAAGLTLLPATLAANAQTESQNNPTLDTTPLQETKNDFNNWGWLGLIGLIGLANFFRKPERVEVNQGTTVTSTSTRSEYRDRI